MNIRSVTAGAALPKDQAARASLIARLGEFTNTARGSLESAGFTVQMVRVATQPLERWVDTQNADAPVEELSALCAEAGIDYCSLGTIQAQGGDVSPDLLDMLPSLLINSQNLFASVQVGDHATRNIDLDAVRASARIIRALAESTPDGFGNLRFAAAANCPPHVPFFPAAYYAEDGRNRGDVEFGLALEAADVAVRAFSTAHTHDEAQSNLLAILVDEGEKISQICSSLGEGYGYTFTGLDISMAPYPTPDRSIASALEMLSGSPLGAPGSLAAAAFFTGVLKEARLNLRTTGYSGLMLPALEDQTLADRAAEGLINLDTLMLLSAVCGLGLDTVPLPGDVSLQTLERIILDMAALAIRLDKPLTARLLPVPGKQAGDPAEWPAFPYFARGKVMPVPETGEPGLISGKSLRI